jgi:hypothetical protein
MYLLLFFILACSAAASPAAPRELNHMMNPTEFHKVPSIPIMGTKVPFPVTLVKGWPGVGGGDLAGRTRTDTGHLQSDERAIYHDYVLWGVPSVEDIRYFGDETPAAHG